MISICEYDCQLEAVWNNIVLQSRSGNFLHLRKYMDYHSDRFVDRSLIIERAGKAIAIFPASWQGSTIISHGGLTYGGLISTEELRAEDALYAFERISDHYRCLGVDKIIYKAIPYIFQRYPAQEDLYALFRVGAKIVRRDVSSAIDLGKSFKYSKGRKWSINKAKKAGVRLCMSEDFSSLHDLISLALRKFDTVPTHSLSDMTLLHERFPEEIVLYEARLESELLAGTVIYDFGDTVHTQYLATSDNGRETGALDYLLASLIEQAYKDRRYFSFGVSTQNAGQHLNAGLIAQKEGFGARAVVHDFYEWTL